MKKWLLTLLLFPVVVFCSEQADLEKKNEHYMRVYTSQCHDEMDKLAKEESYGDSIEWTQSTYVECGSNQILFIIPTPYVGVSHIFKKLSQGIELEVGIIWPYAGVVGYAGASYLFFTEKNSSAFGLGVQTRMTKDFVWDFWHFDKEKKWIFNASPTFEYIKFFDSNDNLKIQLYFPFNVRVGYGWGFQMQCIFKYLIALKVFTCFACCADVPADYDHSDGDDYTPYPGEFFDNWEGVDDDDEDEEQFFFQVVDKKKGG